MVNKFGRFDLSIKSANNNLLCRRPILSSNMEHALFSPTKSANFI